MKKKLKSNTETMKTYRIFTNPITGSMVIGKPDGPPVGRKFKRGEEAEATAELTRLNAAQRLEYLRGEIEAERISYGEIAELQDLAPHIKPGDSLLLGWAGIPETVEN